MNEKTGENFPFAKNHGIDYLFRKNIHSMDGIKGKIKTIYEDFHVHEITRNNNILHLEQFIHGKKINQIIHQNEEDERQKLISSISKTDLHLHVLAKYVNKNDVNTFKQFLTLLHDIYQLKVKSEAGELPQEATREGLDKVSIPYCLFIHLDEMPTREKSHSNEHQDVVHDEEPTDGNKAARRNIHHVIKQYYPFLLTETKNVPQSQGVLAHGNILQGNANSNNNNNIIELTKAKKTDVHISAIQIYPSFNCLKTILPQDIFNKLKGHAKKSRISQNDQLENIICQKLDQMEEKKKITKLPEQVRKFHRENFATDIPYAAEGFIENKKRKIEYGPLSQTSHGNYTWGVNTPRENKKGQGEAEGITTTPNLCEGPVRDNSKDATHGGDPPKETTPTCDEHGVPTNRNTSPSGSNKNGDKGHTPFNQLNYEEHSENDGGRNFLDKLNDHRKKKSEQKKGKNYLHFNLYKENKDICEVLHKIKVNLKKKNGDISYCGIKDKRGITVQRFCIHRAKMLDLFKLIMGGDSDSHDRSHDRSDHRSDDRSGSRSWCNNVYVSNLRYRKKKLSLGDLKGNFFKVLIRGVQDTSEEKFSALAENFKKAGFVNYFGHQRFGSKKIKNYEIGICILKKNYKQALFHVIENAGLDNSKKSRLIKYLNDLEATNGVEDKSDAVVLTTHNDESSHARKDEKDDQEEADQKDAHQKEDPIVCVENAPLPTPNCEKGKNFFKKKKEKKMNGTPHRTVKEEQNQLPKEISEIINSISSHSHVEKTILCSLKNDKNFKNAFMNLPKDIFSLFIHSAQSLIFNILADIRMKKYGFGVVVGDLIDSTRNSEEVLTSDSSTEHYSDETEEDEPLYETNIIPVTHENISLYDMYDVVLPLPGDKNFVFPPNLTEEYKSVLSNLHLSLDYFRSEKNFFSAPGGYRKVVVKPRDFKSLFIKSDGAGGGRIPFIRSDLSRLLEQEGWAANSAINSATNSAAASDESKGDAANPTPITHMEDDMQTHITFVQSDVYHEHLIKEVPNYRTTASILLTCSLPKSSYITVALLEVLNS
ncbi:hypothetical protein AK88_03772 [Plasmodium fragile]|uniref:TRUD domain-containing protein n=1 Tax=Plasmodium fragile TaxID=5857 RepID=A0A0D9QLJ6_PLAFR|nr:uncharacterized protein AK88_03772 [Plasmodium fragile]KJP86576.1 hypothetical protein AK88_03772 [Plasmodium fragile]